MKQIILKRLEILESKITDNEEMVQAIFFYVIDGRKDAIEEKEPVQSWLFPPSCECRRLENESDEDFEDRATIQARKTMKNPFEIPCLFSN